MFGCLDLFLGLAARILTICIWLFICVRLYPLPFLLGLLGIPQFLPPISSWLFALLLLLITASVLDLARLHLLFLLWFIVSEQLLPRLDDIGANL